MDFSGRSTATEWMDTEAVTPADFARCLADLATVNRVTLAHRPTLDFLRRLSRAHPGRTLRLLDVGYGEGDMLRAIHRWAARHGVPLVLSGIDLNPSSAPAALAATPSGMAITYLTGDVFDHRPAAPIDIVISSLFTHHLPDPALERFLDWMEATAICGWFVNDLLRSRIAHAGFTLLANAAGWHRFVRHDGPVSIARSFRPEDWSARLRGIPARVERRFPFRLCVERVFDPPRS